MVPIIMQKISTITGSLMPIILIISVALVHLTTQVNAGHHTFASKAYSAIAKHRLNTNVVISPLSIQTGLALVLFGTNDKTAKEMHRGLQLDGKNRGEVATFFYKFLKNAKSQLGAQLKIANHFYVDESIKLRTNFTIVLRKVFQTQPESLRFVNKLKAAKKINTWVQQRTMGQMKQMITPREIHKNMSALLVNAIYMRARWQNPFDATFTKKENFLSFGNRSFTIDMMYHWGRFLYAELPELNATALGMHFANSEMDMLFVLPNELRGLRKLQPKLSEIDLNGVTSRLKNEDIEVAIPRFKIKFDIDLERPLHKLGISKIFEDRANFHSMSDTPVRLSKAKHIAQLSVRESHIETTLEEPVVTYPAKPVKQLEHRTIKFHADHPFFFAISSNQAVYFTGHLVEF